MQNLKDQVQELHRDLTKHHSLIKAEIMGDILRKALQVDAQIAAEYACVQGMRAVFQEVASPPHAGSRGRGDPWPGRQVWDPRTGWGAGGLAWLQGEGGRRELQLGGRTTPSLFQIWEESYQRVANEQEIYEGPRPGLRSPNPWAEPNSHGPGTGRQRH